MRRGGERAWGLRGLASSTPAWLGGLLLLAAGLYQFTPLKDACLSRCRSPLGFLLTEWRDGRLGALVMGLRHRGFCAGCCWELDSRERLLHGEPIAGGMDEHQQIRVIPRDRRPVGVRDPAAWSVIARKS